MSFAALPGDASCSSRQFLALANILYRIRRAQWGCPKLLDNPWTGSCQGDQDPALCKRVVPSSLPLLGTLHRGATGGKPGQRRRGNCGWQLRKEKKNNNMTLKEDNQHSVSEKLVPVCPDKCDSSGPTWCLVPSPRTRQRRGLLLLKHRAPQYLCASPQPCMPRHHSSTLSTALRRIWANHKAYMDTSCLFLQVLAAPCYCTRKCLCIQFSFLSSRNLNEI